MFNTESLDTIVTTTKIEEATSPVLLARWHQREEGEGGKVLVFYGVAFEKPLWCRVRGVWWYVERSAVCAH